MPVIELGKDLKGKWPTLQCEIDAARVWAHMVYPKDIEKRNELFSVIYAENLFQFFKEIGHPNIIVQPDVMDYVLRAPSSSDVHKATAGRLVRGCHAGQVLWHILFMDIMGIREPSISKALWLIERFNVERVQEGDAKKLPRTEQALRNYWEEFKPVAHFWAAYEISQGWLGSGSWDYEDETNIPYFKANIMARSLFGCTIRDFVGLAEFLRDFGETFQSERVKNHPSVLPPSATWSAPDDYLPQFHGMEIGGFELGFNLDYADWILQTLDDYSVREKIRCQ